MAAVSLGLAILCGFAIIAIYLGAIYAIAWLAASDRWPWERRR